MCILKSSLDVEQQVYGYVTVVWWLKIVGIEPQKRNMYIYTLIALVNEQYGEIFHEHVIPILYDECNKLFIMQ